MPYRSCDRAPALAARHLARVTVPMSYARPPFLRSVVASLPLLVALACNRGSEPPPTTSPAAVDEPASAPTTEAESADETCPSFIGLDVTELPPLPQTPYTPTLEKVWVTVLDKHYDPTLNCLDWPAVRQEYGAKLVDAQDEQAAFEIIAQMLGRLGQSHLAVVPPRKPVAGEPRAAVKSGNAEVPISVRVIGGEAVVVDPAKHGGRASGIPGGAALLAVDDHEVATLLETTAKEHSRPVEASFVARRVIASWLSCPTGASKTLRYQAVGSSKPKTRTIKCRPIEAERVSLGNIKNVPATVEHRMLPGTKVGYLTFDIWMIPLVPKIETAMAELRAEGMESLVIDLRGNPGGVGMMVVPVGRQILAEDVDLGQMRMREGKQVFNITANDDPFTGPVALLVDEGTASTSEIFGQALQDLGRVTVFGAVPSQGAALPSVIEELPGGGMLQYVVADYQSPGGTIVEGRGVQPDTVVPETREDYAKGRDPVLEAAVAALTNPSETR
ncbi:MAG: S41 family peptidase [Nannocystaceae bacterium]